MITCEFSVVSEVAQCLLSAGCKKDETDEWLGFIRSEVLGVPPFLTYEIIGFSITNPLWGTTFSGTMFVSIT
jgi:hypothetical protein